MYEICFYVPIDYVDIVKNALFEVGAGKYRNYECCCWQTLGQGQFKPNSDANPFIGNVNKLEIVPEYKVEMICQDQFIKDAISALKKSHPYEEPAFHIFKINDILE